jgi:hypothetical protein
MKSVEGANPPPLLLLLLLLPAFPQHPTHGDALSLIREKHQESKVRSTDISVFSFS